MRRRSRKARPSPVLPVILADWIFLLWRSEIRPYVYETLMYLVRVHAQVSAAAAPLLERTLNALVEDVAEEALRCFRQVRRFGMGGMLRVRLLPALCYPCPSR